VQEVNLFIKNFIVSTSASIPDYRGSNGLWTQQETGENNNDDYNEIDLTKIKPTYSHYVLTFLMSKKYIKFITSTNCDSLHIKSGVDMDDISELHGNIFKETCTKCKKTFIRDFNVLLSVKNFNKHLTGRYCDEEDCNGELMDNTINFGEYLNSEEVEKAKYNAKKSDLSIVLGSSMKVSPSNSYPILAKKNENGALVIVNLQKTDFDKYCDLRVFSKIDEFMKLVIKEFDLEKEFEKFYEENKK
jgi:NAD-dependent SIR2 family protein deacetylase